MIQKKAGIILTGCGSLDGSDPYEVVSCVINLENRGIRVIPLAVDENQFHCVDHSTGKELEGIERVQFVEASRLCRGKLYKINEIAPSLLDILIIPGGQGSVKNLLTGFGGKDAPSPNPLISAFVSEAHESGVVIGVLSLGEFFTKQVLGPEQKKDVDLLAIKPDELIVDEDKRIVFTPGGLTAGSASDLFSVIDIFIEALDAIASD